MNDPLTSVSTRRTPQSEQATPEQVQNSAGGFVFTIDETMRLRRFLMLGTSGGTYYLGERELTKDNADVVIKFAREDTRALVDEVVSISLAGRAPKQNPALFALAAAASLGDDDGRAYALSVLSEVARTGTHLFIFARYVEQFRGWGRGLRRAVGRWYTEKTVEDAAYQAVKYRQREGWSHRDLLRLSHPKPVTDRHRRLFQWICGRDMFDGGLTVDGSLDLIVAFERAQTAENVGEIRDLIRDHSLTWEMIPDRWLDDPAVWRALIQTGMPQTALMRQLPRLTRLGVLTPMSYDTQLVMTQLTTMDRLRKARVHPISVLLALRTYASGHSMRGESSWEPVAQIVDALDAAFYLAFGAVEPSNKRTLLALDVSSSMTQSISGLPISCREASAAIALVTAATERQHEIVGFTGGIRYSGYKRFSDPNLTRLSISPRQRLDDVIGAVSDLPFGGTDCSLPMRAATEQRAEVDTFVIYTDNETWAGNVQHPYQALREYREKSGINAKLVVVGMTATEFSIADPNDPGMLDVVGFDASVPNVISDYARGL